MRSKSLSRIIVVILLCAFLTISVGRVTRVSAMADPEIIEDVAPVYDTVLYQFKDYVENDLTEPQYEIFALLWGLYTSAMAGAEDYQLANPYESQDGVLNWLKGLGVDAYNTLIGLAPDTIRLPDGSILNTIPIKESLTDTIAVAMGMAVTASQYDDVDDFMDDVDDEQRSHYWIPFSDVTMYGMNSIFETYGGIYAWQFDSQPWSYNEPFVEGYMSDSQQQYYDNAINSAERPIVRVNSPDYSDLRIYSYNGGTGQAFSYMFRDYHNLFIDSQENKIYIVTDHGTKLNSNYNRLFARGSWMSNALNIDNNFPLLLWDYDGNTFLTNVAFDLSQFGTYASVARAYFNNEFSAASQKFFFQDWIQHVYVGTTWQNRHEIYNVSDHNLEDSDQPYYLTPDSQSMFYMDLKGMLQDLINNTNLMNVFLHNIYTPDGVLVHDTDLIRISRRLVQDYETQNPPIPVNLNDIAEITDVSYLQKLKEEATRGGNALADLVAFWHNCDAEIIYLLFGAGITVLIGAFIGKWGHS